MEARNSGPDCNMTRLDSSYANVCGMRFVLLLMGVEEDVKRMSNAIGSHPMKLHRSAARITTLFALISVLLNPKLGNSFFFARNCMAVI